MSASSPDLPERDPTVIVYETLRDNWNAANIDGSFSTDWLHTGWYSGNPNPEISVTWDGEDAGTPTGYNGMAGSGGPTARLSGTVYVDIWVPGDRDATGGVNPKKHVYQLQREVKRIIGDFPNGPTGEDLTSMGVANARRVPEPDDTDVEHRNRVEVAYTRYQGRQ